MKGLKILFICGLIPESTEIKENTKSFMQGAAQAYQLKLIESLKENGCQVDVLSAPFIGSWPKNYKKMSFKYRNGDNESNSFVSFNNIWGIRNFSRYRALKRQLKKTKLEEYDYAVLYSPHTPFVKLAKQLNKKNLKTVLVVPDLPEYMNLNKKISIVYKVFKKFDIQIFRRNLKYIDGFILLTKYMSPFVNLYKKPEMVIEGIADEISEYRNIGDKKILYSGTLNERFGIVDLIESFKLLPQNIGAELIVCGDGDAREFVIKESNEFTNIKYLGSLTLQEVKEQRDKAFLLVNPRKNNEEYTKYSFPSKTMEYLSSGRPVVCYKLDGIPDEYDDVLYYFKSNDIKSMSDKMQEVLNFNEKELKQVYSKEKELLQTKTTSYVGKMILEFFKEIKE